jgi:hypothetical protein
LNRALLDRYLSAASTIGFTPAVMFIPGDGDTPEDQRRRGFLREWSLPNGVPYVDLTTTIHSEEIESVYITDNWHWNARGHAIAAEALHDFLRSEVIDSP